MVDLDLLNGFSKYKNFFDLLLHFIEVDPLFAKGSIIKKDIQFIDYEVNESKKIINLSFKYKYFYFYIIFSYIKGDKDFLFCHQLFIDDPESEKLREKIKGFILDRYKLKDESMGSFLEYIEYIISSYIEEVPVFYKKIKKR